MENKESRPEIKLMSYAENLNAPFDEGKLPVAKPETTCAEIANNKAADKMIPKHRFDCINLCLKETKWALRIKTAELETGKTRIAGLEKALLDAIVEKALAVHRAKNLTAVKALIDFSDLKLEQDGDVPGLEEQIVFLKISQNYLFESHEKTAYVMIPVKRGTGLDKSITNYITNTEKER